VISTGILVGSFAGIGAVASPILAVGDDAQLFVTAAGSIRADDNIYLSSNNAKSDVIWSFAPGLDFVFGQGAANSGHAYITEDILRYTSHSAQNKELANMGLTSLYSTGKSKLDFSATYVQLAQNDVTIPGQIVDRKLTNVTGGGETELTEKTALGASIAYDNTNYGPAAFIDESAISVPVDAYFKLEQKLDASVGVRYRSISFGNGYTGGNDIFYNIGARGEFSPKLTGQIRLGYTDRKLGTFKQTTFGVQSGFDYGLDEKTTLHFGLNNDLGASAFGQSTKDRTLFVSGESRIDSQWSVNLGLSYRTLDYPAGRSGLKTSSTDNYLEGTAGVTYIYNTHFNVDAAFTHRNNSSDLSGAGFSNNIISLGANIRY
jgi:polysaccharide biosynthesis protein VpsM